MRLWSAHTGPRAGETHLVGKVAVEGLGGDGLEVLAQDGVGRAKVVVGGECEGCVAGVGGVVDRV